MGLNFQAGLAFAVVAILSGCGELLSGGSNIAAEKVALDGRSISTGGTWNNSRDGIAIVARAVELDGFVAICGTRATKGVANRSLNQRLLSDHGFKIGDKKIVQNLAYFTRAKSMDDIGTTPGTCKVTTTPWDDAFETAPWEFTYRGDGNYRI